MKVSKKEGTDSVKLTFVTSNQKKWQEAKEILAPYGIEVVAKHLTLREGEFGRVEEVARDKLEQVMIENRDVMVDDTGIYFDAYPDFPGVLSKRLYQMIGYKGIDRLLRGESRKAWFEGAIAVSFRGQIQVFIGRTEGEIDHFDPERLPFDPQRSFPYDPIFIPKGEKEVLEKLDDHRKLELSYRRKALLQMVEWIQEVN